MVQVFVPKQILDQGFGAWDTLPEKIHSFRGNSDDINPQISAAPSSDILWVVAEENLNNSGDWNLVWDYTADDGNVWRADTSFPDIDLSNDPGRDEYFFRLMYGADGSGFARVAYLTQFSPSDIRVDYQFFMSNSWTLTSGIDTELFLNTSCTFARAKKVGTCPDENQGTGCKIC